jgi:hypothetical protein
MVSALIVVELVNGVAVLAAAFVLGSRFFGAYGETLWSSDGLHPVLP